MKTKDCPFCKSKTNSVNSIDCPGGSKKFYTHCYGCGASGPYGDTESEAIKLWNKRERKEKTMTGLAKKACQLIQLLAKLTETDSCGNGLCWYCGETKTWPELYGCHFRPKGRTYRKACIDPRNIHPGCGICNNLNDNFYYTQKMNAVFGDEVLQELDRLNHQELSRQELSEYIEITRKTCRELAKTKTFHVNIP